MKLTDQMLRSIMPNCPATKRAQYLPHLVSAMIKFNITSRLRAAAFLATLAHESAELRFFEEIASGAAYEGRRDLGNIHPGDGKRYKGRGPIQITGRTNSEDCLRFLGLPPGQPKLLATPEHGFEAAGWFWMTRKINALADQNDFLRTQIRVNGKNRRTGLPNNWEDRKKYYKRALVALPAGFVLTATQQVQPAVVVPSVIKPTANGEESDVINKNATVDIPLLDDPNGLEQRTPGFENDVDDFDDIDDVDEVFDDEDEPEPPAMQEETEIVRNEVVAVPNGGPQDDPVIVQAAAPAKERSVKSLTSTIIAAVSSVGLTLGTIVSKGVDYLKENPELVFIIGVAVAAIVVCYVIYQHRQTKLDLADREHARDVTLETMKIRSDPQRINVQVVPRGVPADADSF